MKKRNILLAALAVVLLLSVSIGSALGYFTDHDEGSGEGAIVLRPWTEITETFDSWTKRVVITDYIPDGVDEGAPCFVRVRAYMAGSDVGQVLTISGENWTQNGDWYYYNPILEPEESTTQLNVKINQIPTDPKDGDSFNVVVVYEATPVLYNADGSAYADWNQALNVLN